MTLTQARVFDQGYCNWVKGTLSLLYMKEAIEDVVDTEAVKFHKNIQKALGIYGNAPQICSSCTRKDITRGHAGKKWQMQCSLCNDWLQQIVKNHGRWPLQNLKPENTDPQLWPTSPYEVLKCYMSSGCRADMSAKDGDAQSILNLLRNCNHFTKCGKIGRLDLIDQLLVIRNSLFHAGKLEVTFTDLQTHLQTMLNFLAGLTALTPDQSRSVQEAEQKIRELKNNPLDMSFRELELEALKQKQIALQTDMKSLEDMLTEATLENTSTGDAVNTLMEDMDQMKEFQDQFDRFLQVNDLEQDLARLSTSIKQYDQTLEKHDKQLTDLDLSVQQQDDHISILHQRQQQTEARLQIVERQQGQPVELQQQTDLDTSFKHKDDHISILYQKQQQTEARLEILERRQGQPAELLAQKDNQKKIDVYATREFSEAASTEEATGSKDKDFDSNVFDSEDEDEEDAMFELRDYQIELAEKAVAGKNTVVCAPTGVGKTWVALHIIRNHLEEDTDGSRRVVFVAKTGALTKQQANRIKKYLPQYQTKLLQGEVDNTKIFGQCLRDYQIFCFTPQILVDNLECGNVSSITKLSLIILDECHHTKGDSPYSTLMRKYLMEKYDTRRTEKLPQIIGMTATLGVGQSATDEDALDYILRICALLDVTELSTVKRCKEELYKHTSKPAEEKILMQPRSYDPASDILRYAIVNTEHKLQEIALLQPSFTGLMCKCPSAKDSQFYNKWTYEIMKATHSCSGDSNTLRNIYSCANYLNVYNQALEVNSLLQTEDVIRFLAEKHSADSDQIDKLTPLEQELLRNLADVQRKLQHGAILQENINVHILSGKLRAMLENEGDDSRAMVFVKARATCKALAMFLETDLGDIVKTSALYGKYKRGDDEGMPQAVQDETIQKFREGEYKVLVATSIGVEGIDIPDCNMALNYNFIGNEIVKVQMRGRIRKHGGTNITILKDFDKERLSAYKEMMMQEAMQRFDNLRKSDIEMKVNIYQKEERTKYISKLEATMAKQRMKTNERDYKMCCKKCNTHACFISDVRKCKVQHFVIDKEFVNKIDIRQHSNSRTVEGFKINRKMHCKECPLSWGVIADKDGLDCRILKLDNFKLINMATGAVEIYKKWIDVPYKVREVDVNDLPRLLRD